MNKKLKRILAIALVVMMLPLTTFAANFKDIKSNHWAKEYIDKCSDLGFINGFPDGTFKPNNPIRFLELVKMLSNLFNVPPTEMQTAESLYGAQLDALKPASWARQYLLRCLAKGVVTMSVLKSAKSNGNPNMLKDNSQFAFSRTDTSVLFVKAMGLTPVATSLTYKDKDEIKPSAVPSIGALQKAGVLNPQGDETGRFRPGDALSRAEVAKMLVKAFEYVQKNGGLNSNQPNPTPTPSNPTNPVGTYDNVTGVFKNTFDMGNGMNYISINDKNNKLRVYNLPSSSTIKLNGSTTSISNIKEGMDASLVVQGETVISADFKQSKETLEGTINSIGSHNYDVKIDYKENNRQKSITLDFKDAKIKLDGKNATIDDLKTGYEVKVVYNSDKALEVEAKRNTVADGFFLRFEYRNREDRVYYKKDINSRYEDYYVLDRDVYINKDRKVSSKELTGRYSNNYFVKDQPISFEFARDGKTVTGIYYDFDANKRDGNIFGYIYDNVRSRDQKIILSTKPYRNSSSRDTIDVELDRSVDVYIGNSRRRIEDLNRDMMVNVTMKDGYAIRIEVISGNTYTISVDGIFYGEIYEVNDRDKYIDLDTSYNRYGYSNLSFDNNKISEGSNKILYDNNTKFYINNSFSSLYDVIKALENNDNYNNGYYRNIYVGTVKVEYKSGKYVATELRMEKDPYRN